jgi:hypothetical protein
MQDYDLNINIHAVCSYCYNDLKFELNDCHWPEFELVVKPCEICAEEMKKPKRVKLKSK